MSAAPEEDEFFDCHTNEQDLVATSAAVPAAAAARPPSLAERRRRVAERAEKLKLAEEALEEAAEIARLDAAEAELARQEMELARRLASFPGKKQPPSRGEGEFVLDGSGIGDQGVPAGAGLAAGLGPA